MTSNQKFALTFVLAITGMALLATVDSHADNIDVPLIAELDEQAKKYAESKCEGLEPPEYIRCFTLTKGQWFDRNSSDIPD